ncbi:DUF3995 domain-containing protein [Streptomyces olivoreticuli]|uniref:DUF3995 domain-containing protein n=1 Tax=Streptomyces olivoreticuli TaxID=68246 RepID=UPI001F07A84B|nr:DUF3995 domain-containing protein [Streptomyces olivoreticuli]
MADSGEAVGQATADASPGGPGSWTGYAGAAIAFGFALVSFYWAAGGTALLETLGGKLEELARERDSSLIAGVWLTGAAKGVGGLLSLALVQRWGRRLPRRLLLTLGRVGTVALSAYGGILIAVQALVALDLVVPDTPPNWTALLWHLFVWDMSFLVWGILLGLATRHYSKRHPRRSRAAG